MNNSRRSFLKKSALAGTLAFAGTSLLSESLFAAKGKKLTGLQLYSVRDDMKNDPMGTLKALSDMGYKYVEHANYIDRKFYGWSATEFKKILSDLGMDMPSGHTVLRDNHWDDAKKDFTDVWKYTIEDAATVGQMYVISPSMTQGQRKEYDQLMLLLERFNQSGQLCKKSGMLFGYHNHDFEFNESLNGELLYDIIMKNTDPTLVMQQLDIGNLYNGGATALEITKKWPGRFASMHVKDEIKSAAADGDRYESCVLGTGIVPVKEVIDIGKKDGTIHFIIEQEAYQGKTPLAAMKENIQIMKNWGYK